MKLSRINYNGKDSLTIQFSNGNCYIVKAWIRWTLVGWIGFRVQSYLYYKKKISWHDWLGGQCTPGFECCMHKIKSEEDKTILRGILNMRILDIPVAGFNKDGTNDVLDRFMDKPE